MTRKTVASALVAPLLVPGATGTALADGTGGPIGWLTGSREFPPVDNPAYRSECGGCHLAFPPGLMTAND